MHNSFKVQSSKISCAFGSPVPDLFDKRGGSLRGFAQGVATISRFPVFDGSHLLDLDTTSFIGFKSLWYK